MSASDAITTRLNHAIEQGRAAARLIMQYAESNFSVERKGDDSPVTVADREAELQLRRSIEAAFPDDGILGEEFDTKAGSNGFRWILDPIDGTKSFISSVPLFGTMIGIQFEEESVAGVVEFPGLNERIYAAQGQGCWTQRADSEATRAQVSQTPLSEGLFVTTEVESFRERDALGLYETLEKRAWFSRTWGDCYGYYLVATGRATAMVDPGMSIWDAAPLLPIMEEAGGRFTDWSGVRTVDGGEGLATNGVDHDAILDLMRR